MSSWSSVDKDEVIFAVWTTTLVLSIGVFITLWMSMYDAYYSAVATEAIKAGLVQQPVSEATDVWVKPEDYKPYAISKYDSPYYSRER